MSRSKKNGSADEVDEDKKKSSRRVTFNVADASSASKKSSKKSESSKKSLKDKSSNKSSKSSKSSKSNKSSKDKKSSKSSKSSSKDKSGNGKKPLRRQSKRIGKNLETKSNKNKENENSNGEKEEEEEEVVVVPKPKLATPGQLLPETDVDHTKLLFAMFFNKLQKNPGAYSALGEFGKILQKNRIDPTEVLTSSIDFSPDTMQKLQYDIADRRFLYTYARALRHYIYKNRDKLKLIFRLKSDDLLPDIKIKITRNHIIEALMRNPEETIGLMPEDVQKEFFHLLKSDVNAPIMAQLTQKLPGFLEPNPMHCIRNVDGKLPNQPEIIDYERIKKLELEAKLDGGDNNPNAMNENENNENENENENKEENKENNENEEHKTDDSKKGKKNGNNKKGKTDDSKDSKESKKKGNKNNKKDDKASSGKDKKDKKTESKDDNKKGPKSILKNGKSNQNLTVDLARDNSKLSMKMVAASVSFAQEDADGNIVHKKNQSILPSMQSTLSVVSENGGLVMLDDPNGNNGNNNNIDPRLLATIDENGEPLPPLNEQSELQKRKSILGIYGQDKQLAGVAHLGKIDYNNIPPVPKPYEEALPMGVLPNGATTTRIGELLESFKDCQLLAEKYAIKQALDSQYSMYKYGIYYQEHVEWFDPPISSDSTRLWQEEAVLELEKIRKEEERIRKGWENTYQQCVKDIDSLLMELDYRKNVIKQVNVYDKFLSAKLSEIHKDVQKKREELHLHGQKREKYLINAKRAQQDEHRLRSRIETALRTQTVKTRELARLKALLGETQWKVNNAPRHYEKHVMTRLGIFNLRDEVDSKLQAELKIHKRWEKWFNNYSKFDKYIKKYSEHKLGGKTWKKYKYLWQNKVLGNIENRFSTENYLMPDDIDNLKYVGVSTKSHKNNFNPLHYMLYKNDIRDKRKYKEYSNKRQQSPEIEISYPKDVVYDRFIARLAPPSRRKNIYDDPSTQDKIRVDFEKQQAKYQTMRNVLVDVHGNKMVSRKRAASGYGTTLGPQDAARMKSLKKPTRRRASPKYGNNNQLQAQTTSQSQSQQQQQQKGDMKQSSLSRMQQEQGGSLTSNKSKMSDSRMPQGVMDPLAPSSETQSASRLNQDGIGGVGAASAGGSSSILNNASNQDEKLEKQESFSRFDRDVMGGSASHINATGGLGDMDGVADIVPYYDDDEEEEDDAPPINKQTSKFSETSNDRQGSFRNQRSQRSVSTAGHDRYERETSNFSNENNNNRERTKTADENTMRRLQQQSSFKSNDGVGGSGGGGGGKSNRKKKHSSRHGSKRGSKRGSRAGSGTATPNADGRRAPAVRANRAQTVHHEKQSSTSSVSRSAAKSVTSGPRHIKRGSFRGDPSGSQRSGIGGVGGDLVGANGGTLDDELLEEELIDDDPFSGLNRENSGSVRGGIGDMGISGKSVGSGVGAGGVGSGGLAMGMTPFQQSSKPGHGRKISDFAGGALDPIDSEASTTTPRDDNDTNDESKDSSGRESKDSDDNNDGSEFVATGERKKDLQSAWEWQKSIQSIKQNRNKENKGIEAWQEEIDEEFDQKLKKLKKSKEYLKASNNEQEKMEAIINKQYNEQTDKLQLEFAKGNNNNNNDNDDMSNDSPNAQQRRGGKGKKHGRTRSVHFQDQDAFAGLGNSGAIATGGGRDRADSGVGGGMERFDSGLGNSSFDIHRQESGFNMARPDSAQFSSFDRQGSHANMFGTGGGGGGRSIDPMSNFGRQDSTAPHGYNRQDSMIGGGNAYNRQGSSIRSNQNDRQDSRIYGFGNTRQQRSIDPQHERDEHGDVSTDDDHDDDDHHNERKLQSMTSTTSTIQQYGKQTSTVGRSSPHMGAFSHQDSTMNIPTGAPGLGNRYTSIDALQESHGHGGDTTTEDEVSEDEDHHHGGSSGGGSSRPHTGRSMISNRQQSGFLPQGNTSMMAGQSLYSNQILSPRTDDDDDDDENDGFGNLASPRGGDDDDAPAPSSAMPKGSKSKSKNKNKQENDRPDNNNNNNNRSRARSGTMHQKQQKSYGDMRLQSVIDDDQEDEVESKGLEHMLSQQNINILNRQNSGNVGSIPDSTNSNTMDSGYSNINRIQNRNNNDTDSLGTPTTNATDTNNNNNSSNVLTLQNMASNNSQSALPNFVNQASGSYVPHGNSSDVQTPRTQYTANTNNTTGPSNESNVNTPHGNKSRHGNHTSGSDGTGLWRMDSGIMARGDTDRSDDVLNRNFSERSDKLDGYQGVMTPSAANQSSKADDSKFNDDDDDDNNNDNDNENKDNK